METKDQTTQMANRKPSLSEVDSLANTLAERFDNHAYRPWYCTAIYELGTDRIRQILARVSDGEHPNKLFSKIVKEELNAIRNKRRLNSLKERTAQNVSN